MQSPKLSEWLSILANVGVLIGIFLLIAEVNHASRLSEAEGHQVRTKDIQELNLQFVLNKLTSLYVLDVQLTNLWMLSIAEHVQES